MYEKSKALLSWTDFSGNLTYKKSVNTQIWKESKQLSLVVSSLNILTYVLFHMFQNTITNADKLLVAAHELAATGECAPHEISSEANTLERRMHAFLERVECRRHLLDMAVNFYTHAKEVRNKTCQ